MRKRMMMAAVAVVAVGGGLYVKAQVNPPATTLPSDLWAYLPDPDLRKNPFEPPPQRKTPLQTFAPGTDTCLGMSWEPTIVVDPNDPNVVVAAQFLTMQISLDGGDTFIAPVTATVPANWCPGGDPSLAFDSQGRLFITYLGSPPPLAGENCGNSTNPGRDVFISGFQRSGNTFIPIPGIAWPVNVTAAAGFGAPNNADKEWLAADFWPGKSHH